MQLYRAVLKLLVCPRTHWAANG